MKTQRPTPLSFHLHTQGDSSKTIRYFQRLILYLLLIVGLFAHAEPVKIIFDTDMDTDCDDAGALAMLHALEHLGEVEILATVTCSKMQYAAPCIDAINTYFGRPDLPIGVPRSTTVPDSRSSRYNDHIADEFYHDIGDYDSAPDALAVYREVLAAQPDNSVTIVTVGYLTNIRDLLQSEPDNYSPLNGHDLVVQKVKRWVCMGGPIPAVDPDQGPSGSGNFKPQAAATVYAVENWPVELVFAGHDLGKSIKTGLLLFDTASSDNPVRRIYELWLGRRRTRPSYDQTAVLYAARGAGNYWDLVTEGQCTINEYGAHTWVTSPDSNHSYLTPKMDEDDLEDIIDELMAYEPDTPPSNHPPQVDAGPDQTVIFTRAVNLTASVSDDELPDPPASVTVIWSKQNGPGVVTFGDTSQQSTTANFSETGTYILRLSADDSELNSYDELTVTVIESGLPNNTPDQNLNLALMDEAVLSSSVTDGGRANLPAILYDPATDDYSTQTKWNEHGVDSSTTNLGTIDEADAFYWMVEWPVAKSVNYITFGGTYPNQPQPNTLWKVQYRSESEWNDIATGQGGWIDSGIFEWGGTDQTPVTADAIRVLAYSDGINDVVGIHLRGRGGVSSKIDDSATTPKATLIQYIGEAVDQSTVIQQWRDQYDLATDGSEDLQILSSDGLPALLKLAFNLGDPKESNSHPIDPEATELGGIPTLDQTNGLRFNYIRHTRPDSGLNYEEMACQDLQSNSWVDPDNLSNLVQERQVSAIPDSDYEWVSLTLNSNTYDYVFFRININKTVTAP